ncbi:Rieske (2Fe-2S) protein [Candidatus Acidianus copahuensis]|uniref:Rieske (2Fe-2S) protein n=1 Tax=Candidatus Acidianus copahuensis TaxID=1160895 RepID=A0A031LPG1_9CREN|nr:Rieske (2Fe-2S) protein [Candidatus Acidianus copahuensis]
MAIAKPEMKPGEKKKIKTEEGEVLLIYLGGDKYIATEAKCPHLGCDLEKYGVLIREEIVCQCHFSHFSILDGKPIKGASKKSLKIFKVITDGNLLKITSS